MDGGITEMLAMSLPTIIMGIVAYYFINIHLKSLNREHKYEALLQRKKDGLPIKIKAYERMVLFCDRLNPIKLLIRVKPMNQSVEDYLQLLLQNIEQEFEHNSVQQIYISDTCWNVIITAKSAIIAKLKHVANTCTNAQELREHMMTAYKDATPPTDTAVSYIKREVQKLI